MIIVLYISYSCVIMFIDLFCRETIQTVGPKYALKYHRSAESALSYCYRYCLELLLENGLERYISSFEAWILTHLIYLTFCCLQRLLCPLKQIFYLHTLTYRACS
jgi:hypothetical protein